MGGAAPARAPAQPVARPPGWLLSPPGLSLPNVFLYMSKDASSIALDGIVRSTSARQCTPLQAAHLCGLLEAASGALMLDTGMLMQGGC